MSDGLPDPPDHLDASEKAAWRAGGAAMLRFLGGHAMHLAGAMQDGNPTAADDVENPCPKCGTDLIQAFGGEEICPDCDYRSAESETDDT